VIISARAVQIASARSSALEVCIRIDSK